MPGRRYVRARQGDPHRCSGSRCGTRTHTGIALRILSPVRLPIPASGHALSIAPPAVPRQTQHGRRRRHENNRRRREAIPEAEGGRPGMRHMARIFECRPEFGPARRPDFRRTAGHLLEEGRTHIVVGGPRDDQRPTYHGVRSRCRTTMGSVPQASPGWRTKFIAPASCANRLSASARCGGGQGRHDEGEPGAADHGERRGGGNLLAQGTLYPDVIESALFADGVGTIIKSHRNIGGPPERLRTAPTEPPRALFKDEVRAPGGNSACPRRRCGGIRSPVSRCAFPARLRPTRRRPRAVRGRILMEEPAPSASTTGSGRLSRRCSRCARSA